MVEALLQEQSCGKYKRAQIKDLRLLSFPSKSCPYKAIRAEATSRQLKCTLLQSIKKIEGSSLTKKQPKMRVLSRKQAGQNLSAETRAGDNRSSSSKLL